MFDWKRFLTKHNIEFVTRGPNVARGRIAVKCPWCGKADPSQHLWISLKGANWGCWRNSSHSGHNKTRLIQAILRCSFAEAQALAGEETGSSPTDNQFKEQVSGLLGFEKTKVTQEPLGFPSEFKSLVKYSNRFDRQFWIYLKQRGYIQEDAFWLAKKYKLHYAVRGHYAYRLIIPIFDHTGALMTWTGRHIDAAAEVRYKTLPQQLARRVPGELLLGIEWLPQVKQGKLLVVCEGPFDAMRITALGHEQGIYGTCLFGLNISQSQVGYLQDLSSTFDSIGLLLDADAEMAVFRIKEKLSALKVHTLKLPAGVKDAGELTNSQASKVMVEWLKSNSTGRHPWLHGTHYWTTV